MQQYRSSRESYDAFIRLFRIFSRLCGADILDDDYQIDIRTITLCSTVASYLVSVFYSVFYYYPDWLDVVEVCSLMGLGCQGAVKLNNFICYSEHYRQENRWMLKFLSIHSDHPKNNAALLSVLNKIHIFKVVLLIAYFSGMVLIGFFPLGYYLMFGEPKLAMNFLVPWVDPGTRLGFGITQVYHLIINVLSAVGIAAMDLIIMMVIASVAGLVDVYLNKLEELDELLESEPTAGTEIRDMVLEIIELHQKIIRLVEIKRVDC